MPDDPLGLVGTVLDGKFRVDEFVEEGDLNVLYRGHQLADDTPVAIKALNLPTTLDAALGEPFARSFREASRLHARIAGGNRNIVQTVGQGTATAPHTGQEVPFEVREWLEGRTLLAHISKRRVEGEGGWPLDEAVELLGPVAEGLAYAHAQGVLHLAVNPRNLFVVDEEGTRPATRILDVGEGRPTGEKGARVKPVLRVLLPQYAAPELIDKSVGALGPWSDVFSLAVVLLELLAGGMATREVAAVVLTDPKNRPSPQKLGLSLPKPVEGVLDRALAVEPTRRPADMATFWKELGAAARGEAVGPSRATATATTASTPTATPITSTTATPTATPAPTRVPTPAYGAVPLPLPAANPPPKRPLPPLPPRRPSAPDLPPPPPAIRPPAAAEVPPADEEPVAPPPPPSPLPPWPPLSPPSPLPFAPPPPEPAAVAPLPPPSPPPGPESGEPAVFQAALGGPPVAPIAQHAFSTAPPPPPNPRAKRNLLIAAIGGVTLLIAIGVGWCVASPSSRSAAPSASPATPSAPPEAP